MIENKIEGTFFSSTNKTNNQMEVYFSSVDKTYLIYMDNSEEFLGIFNKEDKFSDIEYYINNILNLIQSLNISSEYKVICIVKNKGDVYEEIFMFNSEIIYRNTRNKFMEIQELVNMIKRTIQYDKEIENKKNTRNKKTSVQSIEPDISLIGNKWLEELDLKIFLEQKEINDEITNAFKFYSSKNGGTGGNRPDVKLLLKPSNSNSFIPILIEYKGLKDKLVKLDSDGIVENINKNTNEPNYNNIKGYAVNGAIHYANAILHHTTYTEVISIGMTGYIDSKGKIQHEIGVYYVSKSNLGVGQKVGEYTDFSFLSKENFDNFIEKAQQLNLSPEALEKVKFQREKEIDISLSKLNNDIYNNEKGLGENDRIYLVAAAIISTLGVPGIVPPLKKEQLISSSEKGERDCDVVMRKIENFLEAKEIPKDKKDLIIRTLSNTLLSEKINKIENNETQLKRIFYKIIDDLGIYYKIGLNTDFTGKLFNEMYAWLGFSEDRTNDVVLTPSYVSKLLVKLAKVNHKSYVWDLATGSGGLLVAAMNEMLIDAKTKITSPDELNIAIKQIKAEQLLGVELLPSVYMLAILNMILMGDGSSNILNKDSLIDFDGRYEYGEKKGKQFKATSFILNPPYSAEGNGMIFVEKALEMMEKGYAAVIIQASAGSGKAKEINKRILKKHSLIASIKMPVDIFIGKASVQTNIYVFKVGEEHEKDNCVKFIDFSNDGYTRSNRKKATNNLKNTGDAELRYEQIVKLVHQGRIHGNLFSDREYFEGFIDPENGADWNQVAKIETKPTLNDFEKTIGDFMSWEISTILKKSINQGK